MKMFLGEHVGIKKWIINHHPFWIQLVKNLESFPTQRIIELTSPDQLIAGVLPMVGQTIWVDYKIDTNGDAVSTEWQILGYNKSIPERVKYKSGNNIIYVETTSSGLLSEIRVGTLVYSDKSSSDAIGSVSATSGINVTVDGNTGTYGNNNPYNAPTTVTVGGTVYDFAGYNMTIMSRYIIATKSGNVLYHYVTFDESDSDVSNVWSTSKLRKWMNETTEVENITWSTTDWTSTSNGGTGLISRLPDQDFLNSIIPTVNRTWVHPDHRSGKTLDSNDCEHTVDKFWLLGVGNVNSSGISNDKMYYHDAIYDTSKFSEIFTITDDIFELNDSRVRTLMNSDGKNQWSAANQWIRSAFLNPHGAYYAGYVSDTGNLNGLIVNYSLGGCLPVCSIG